MALSHAGSAVLSRGLLALACCLTAVVTVEVLWPGAVLDDLAPMPGPAAIARHDDHPAANRTQLTARAATIVARPLFDPTRHPMPAAAQPANANEVRPRLSGVIVNGAQRMALFVAGPGEKPRIVREGEAIGPWTLGAISPGEVMVIGVDGPRQLRPMFDARVTEAAMPGPKPDPSAVALEQSRKALLDLVQQGPQLQR
jgi:hypothetical protein